jgi:hypothetical protein
VPVGLFLALGHRGIQRVERDGNHREASDQEDNLREALLAKIAAGKTLLKAQAGLPNCGKCSSR